MPVENTSIVILGATGDLAQRKLVPALFQLACKGRLPTGMRIVGFAHQDYTEDQFRELMWDSIQQYGDLAVRRDEWAMFARDLHYVGGDLSSLEDFTRLGRRLAELETDDGANRLFYLSIAPRFFDTSIENLGAAGLATKYAGWRRVVIEKPFGRDLESARSLNRTVHSVFDERHVYRIDHYLGKETVQNLLALRFANGMFESVWNRECIDNVQITVAEELGVGDRAGYYDQSGVVRDMVQNHLLQLLAVVAMEPPTSMDADSLRDQKVAALQAIRPMALDATTRDSVLGQYQGYLDQLGVASGSAIPTFAALRLGLDNPRWQGVPFFLRTGKALATKVTEIIVQFRLPQSRIFQGGSNLGLNPNALGMCLQPDEGLHLRFEVKVPDEGMSLQPRDMEFHYESAFGIQAIPEAYERLIYDALEGDPTLFIRSDHIEEAWRIVDPLVQVWETGKGRRPHSYDQGSWGPEAAEGLLSREGFTWNRMCDVHDGADA